MIIDIIKPALLVMLLMLIYYGAMYLYRSYKEEQMLKELVKSGIDDIDKMDGLQFEVYLKALLREIGYRSLVTSGSHDFGADLVLKKGNKKVVIQAKRYGYKNKVGLDAVQQVYGAKAYYKAHECWVMTNSEFTKSAKKLATACNVKLFDRNKLVKLINSINPSITAKKVIERVEPKPRKCPSCSGELIRRKSKSNNYFLGCSNFPECKHTENIAN